MGNGGRGGVERRRVQCRRHGRHMSSTPLSHKGVTLSLSGRHPSPISPLPQFSKHDLGRSSALLKGLARIFLTFSRKDGARRGKDVFVCSSPSQTSDSILVFAGSKASRPASQPAAAVAAGRMRLRCELLWRRASSAQPVYSSMRSRSFLSPPSKVVRHVPRFSSEMWRELFFTRNASSPIFGALQGST